MSTIQDTDLLLLNQGGRDYKITAKQYKEFVNSKPMPWDDPQYEGQLYHVKNVQNGPLTLQGYYNPYKAWTLDGTETAISEVKEGEEFVIWQGPDEDGSENLFAANRTATWEFGKYTNTSKVISFYFLFQDTERFNAPLTGFDTSNALYLGSMFTGDFNQPIGHWDVSKVKDFTFIFNGCNGFNQDISGWDTSGVESWGMDSMFIYCNSFNQDLSNWCVSSVTSKPSYFDHDCDSWTLPQPVWGTCPRGEDQS